MTPTEVEDALKNCNRRLTQVEEILPTLATKQDLERFATKKDLERFATKEELREGLAEARRHANILVESVRDDIRILAEAVVSVIHKVDANAHALASLTERLERRGVI